MRGKWEIRQACQQKATQFDAAGFCQHCQQTVHDLSRLTRSEAMELYYANGGKLCIRMTRDANGEVEFRPDPPSSLGGWIRSSLIGITMAAGPAVAQDTAPTGCPVEVRVLDESGAAIPGAIVTISSAPKARLSEVQGHPGGFGIYRGEVPSGAYQVRVAVAGFRTWVRDEVACRSMQEPVKVEAVLQIGSTGGGIFIDPVPGPIRKLQFGIKRMFRR